MIYNSSMQTISIENRTIFRILVSIAAFLVLIKFVLLIQTPLVWIATSFFLAVALNPPVSYVAKHVPRKSRALAIMTVVLSFLVVVGLLMYLFIPPLVTQSAALVQSIPGALDSVEHWNGPLGNAIRHYDLSSTLDNASAQIFKSVSSATGSAIGILGSVFGGVAATITVFSLTFFMSLESERWLHNFWALTPAKHRKSNKELAGQMYRAVTGYVNGNLFTSLVAGVLSATLLAVLGVPYSVPLGVLVAVLDLIPLVGASIAAIIVIIISLFTSLPAAVIMAVFFLAYQQVENSVLQPLVYGKSTELSPLVVTVAIIIGAAAGGLFGALIAIPVAASIKVVLVHIYGNRIEQYDPDKI